MVSSVNWSVFDHQHRQSWIIAADGWPECLRCCCRCCCCCSCCLWSAAHMHTSMSRKWEVSVSSCSDPLRNTHLWTRAGRRLDCEINGGWIIYVLAVRVTVDAVLSIQVIYISRESDLTLVTAADHHSTKLCCGFHSVRGVRHIFINEYRFGGGTATQVMFKNHNVRLRICIHIFSHMYARNMHIHGYYTTFSTFISTLSWEILSRFAQLFIVVC